jgi:hypothetical protein
MNTTLDPTSLQVSQKPGEECTPLTEFFNGVDRIFLSLPMTGVVTSFDISSSTTPTQGPQVTEPGGTSSVVVDNVSTQPQASSIYFSTLGTSSNCGNNYCAVKLTQATLQ